MSTLFCKCFIFNTIHYALTRQQKRLKTVFQRSLKALCTTVSSITIKEPLHPAVSHPAAPDPTLADTTLSTIPYSLLPHPALSCSTALHPILSNLTTFPSLLPHTKIALITLTASLSPRLESESLLQAAAVSRGDLKGGKKVKLHLTQDDSLSRIGGPGSTRVPSGTGEKAERNADMLGLERDVKEEKRGEGSEGYGERSVEMLVGSEDGIRSSSMRARKRIRYEEEDDSDCFEDGAVDLMSPIQPAITSSSSSSSSSSRFQFPTRPLFSDPFRVTDRWLSIDTSSFSAPHCGLQAMILVSQLA